MTMNLRKYVTKSYVLRYIVVVQSIFLVGLAMSIMRISAMGTEPFSCLNYSISEHFGIPMGITMAGINGILLVLSFFTMRESLGFGTVANMLLLGTAADIWGNVIQKLAGHSISFSGMEHFGIRILLLCAGMVMMVFFCSFYMSCEMGMSPYDSLGYIIEKLTGKIPFKWARVAADSICVVTAYFFARMNGTQWELIGIGTVIMAFCIGPLLSFFRKNVAEPFVEKIKNM